MHVLKPETAKRNHGNDKNETTKTRDDDRRAEKAEQLSQSFFSHGWGGGKSNFWYIGCREQDFRRAINDKRVVRLPVVNLQQICCKFISIRRDQLLLPNGKLNISRQPGDLVEGGSE